MRSLNFRLVTADWTRLLQGRETRRVIIFKGMTEELIAKMVYFVSGKL